MHSPKDNRRNRKRTEYLSNGSAEAAALAPRQLFAVFELLYELSHPQPAYKMIYCLEKQQERQQAQADKIQGVKIQKIADKAAVAEDNLRGKSAEIHPAGQQPKDDPACKQLVGYLLERLYQKLAVCVYLRRVGVIGADDNAVIFEVTYNVPARPFIQLLFLFRDIACNDIAEIESVTHILRLAFFKLRKKHTAFLEKQSFFGHILKPVLYRRDIARFKRYYTFYKFTHHSPPPSRRQGTASAA